MGNSAWRDFTVKRLSRQRSQSSRTFRNEPREICVFGLNFPPEPTGIGPYLGGLASGLAAAGHDVAAFVAYPHYPKWEVQEGYRGFTRDELFHGVPVRRLRHYVPRPPRGVRRLASELSFGVRLVASRWGSPRVVISVSPPLFASAMVALRIRLTRRRPRLILWVQDIYSLGLAETGEGGTLVRRITKEVEKWTMRGADHVVVIHSRFAEFVIDQLGVPEASVVVSRNWTHLPASTEIESQAAKSKLGWISQPFLAVHTGNMGVKQALENIVDAARLADERGEPVQFVLVGEGGERAALEEYGRGVARLTFVDPLADDEYRLALGAADVLLVNEKAGVSEMAMPSKLTAYFDAGRPVVAATDPAGITASELAAAQAGVVVPAGDPAALLDAVLALQADPNAAASYAANGRRHREAVLGEGAAIQRWRDLVESSAHTPADQEGTSDEQPFGESPIGPDPRSSG